MAIEFQFCRDWVTPSKAGTQGWPSTALAALGARFHARGCAHMFGWYRSYREPLPLSARLRGEREGPGAVATGG